MESIVKATKELFKCPLYLFERELYFSGVLSLQRLTLPHFLVLGSGQSGSSWLHRVLGNHSEICLPDKKETHYFSRNVNTWSLGYYASLFEEGKDKIRGEITPGYNILRSDRIRLIRRIVPDVKLVLIIRNPIDRSWSEARRSLSKVAKEQGISLDQLDDSAFYDYFQKEWMYRPEWGGAFEHGLLQGQYSRVIDNWLAVFPQQQLHVCFFDQILQDPRAFLRSISEHIGVDPDFDWDPDALDTVVNKNPEHRLPDRFRSALEDRYCPEIEELHRQFGDPVEDWLCRDAQDRPTPA